MRRANARTIRLLFPTADLPWCNLFVLIGDTPVFPWPQYLFHTDPAQPAAASVGSTTPFVAKAQSMRALSAKMPVRIQNIAFASSLPSIPGSPFAGAGDMPNRVAGPAPVPAVRYLRRHFSPPRVFRVNYSKFRAGCPHRTAARLARSGPAIRSPALRTLPENLRIRADFDGLLN
jgi:hypothetical protein